MIIEITIDKALNLNFCEDFISKFSHFISLVKLFNFNKIFKKYQRIRRLFNN